MGSLGADEGIETVKVRISLKRRLLEAVKVCRFGPNCLRSKYTPSVCRRHFLLFLFISTAYLSVCVIGHFSACWTIFQAILLEG